MATTSAMGDAGSAAAGLQPGDSVFSVAFQEEGLPNNTTWFVSFNGSSFVADTITNGSGEVDFDAANGTYAFVVQPNMWYAITNQSGSVVVNGTDATIDVTFTALPTVPLVFREAGLPSGSLWGVTLGYPAVVQSTVLTVLAFNVPNVSVPFNVTPPLGYGVGKVAGPTLPSQVLVNVTGRSTLSVTFGPIETLSFNETGLPTGTFWGIAITSSLAHGGPDGQAANTTGSTISFSVVKGSWKFHLTDKPSTYRAHPGKGSVGVPAHAVNRLVKFTLISENVVFHRTGLLTGTMWGVNLTGPLNLTLSGTTATLRAKLCNGTYNWTAWDFSLLHPHAASGSVTVVAPSATHVIVVAYTALPVALAPQSLTGALTATVPELALAVAVKPG